MHQFKFGTFVPFGIFMSLILAMYIYINNYHQLTSSTHESLNLDASQFITHLEQEHHTKIISNKPIVMEVFTSWCGACAANNAQLMAASKDIGLHIYGIVPDSQQSAVRSWLAQHGNPFKQIFFVKGYDALVKIGVTALPETFIVDENRKIVFKSKGVVNIQTLKDAVHQAIDRSSRSN